MAYNILKKYIPITVYPYWSENKYYYFLDLPQSMREEIAPIEKFFYPPDGHTNRRIYLTSEIHQYILRNYDNKTKFVEALP